jgi:hypothetical protein
MKRSGNNKSPAKIKRKTNRLLAHLFKTIHKKSTLPLVKPTLSISPASLTNYPEPCLACTKVHMTRTMEYILPSNLPWKNNWTLFGRRKKPPDDASGLIVATKNQQKHHLSCNV